MDFNTPRPLTREEFNLMGGAELMRQQAEIDEINRMNAALIESDYGRIGKIGTEEIKRAADTLKKYKDGKANLEKRIIEDEEFWKLRHWSSIIKPKTIREEKGVEEPEKRPDPASAWLFNALANKHADAMDNYPEPNVLAREESDKADAKILSEILPVVMDYSNFPKTYSRNWWPKLKSGTGVYSVLWDTSKAYGKGDIAINRVDLLNMFWEPGIDDIQKSRNLFVIELRDNDLLEEEFSFLKNKLGDTTLEVSKYIYDDTVDTTDKSCVVSWYYKVKRDGRDILHYCQFVNDQVLYASENDPRYAERGFYDHGKYPFVFDVLFPEEGTPAGYGYIDIMKSTQLYIDKLDENILESSIMAGKTRFIVKDNVIINEEEFADFSKTFIHAGGGNISEDNMRQIQVQPVPSTVVEVKNGKIDELKETTGNRDFSQGASSGGVTAASAIAALQEAGSKLSRDMIKASYNCYEEICYLCIELIRQFYDQPRTFRIIGDHGAVAYTQYDNSNIKAQSVGNVFGVDMGSRLPVFDIRITAQKASPFSKISQNELAKELYGAGFFDPDMVDQVMIALEMMSFEGKDMVEQKVAQNGMLAQRVAELQALSLKLATIVDEKWGTNIAQTLVAEMNTPSGGMPTGNLENGTVPQTDSLGAAVATGIPTADAAKERAMNIAEPR